MRYVVGHENECEVGTSILIISFVRICLWIERDGLTEVAINL